MKVWWVTDNRGVMLGLLTRVYNISKIVALMYEPRCEFEIQDNTATLLSFRVKDPKFPKWADFVTVRGIDVPNTGETTFWWVTGERGAFLGLVPKDADMMGYLEMVFREDEVHIVLTHEEDELMVYEIKWEDRTTVVRAEKMRVQV